MVHHYRSWKTCLWIYNLLDTLSSIANFWGWVLPKGCNSDIRAFVSWRWSSFQWVGESCYPHMCGLHEVTWGGMLPACVWGPRSHTVVDVGSERVRLTSSALWVYNLFGTIHSITTFDGEFYLEVLLGSWWDQVQRDQEDVLNQPRWSNSLAVSLFSILTDLY